MIFTVGIVGLIFCGALIICLAIGWFTLHFGESFQDRYAKGVTWKVIADVVCGGGIVLLFLLGKWVAKSTGVW